MLDDYARDHIFRPLGMKETMFLPPASLAPRIAPTERTPKDGPPLRGVVHDPTARNMGGVAGHAGLFSTADDLARFAQMMLNGGELDGVRLFSPLTIEKFTEPQSPPDQPILRGLGWDIDSPLFRQSRRVVSHRLVRPHGLHRHVHLDRSLDQDLRDPAGQQRASHAAAGAHAAALEGGDHRGGGGGNRGARRHPDRLQRDLHRQPACIARWRANGSTPHRPRRAGRREVPAAGRQAHRAHHQPYRRGPAGPAQRGPHAAGRNATWPRCFRRSTACMGKEDRPGIQDATDAATGIKVFSLYGATLRPTPEMLRGLDALVFDIQDVGARFYTYETTMAYAMEAAAKAGIPFYVLDRPNPITGTHVEGPAARCRQHIIRRLLAGLPVRHGMTMGELARLFNAEKKIGAKLTVIADGGLAARRLVGFHQPAVDRPFAQHAQPERGAAVSGAVPAGIVEELFGGARHGCAVRADRRGFHRRARTGGVSEPAPDSGRARLSHQLHARRNRISRACASRACASW